MPHEITAGQMLDAFKADAPGHVPGTRWAHTHGIGVVGHFVASDVARDYCIADHFQGHVVPVVVRLSNGSSEPVRHDERPDTRGLAVKFTTRDGSEHDLLSMTLPVFGAKTREEFLEISKAFIPRPLPPPPGFWRRVADLLMLRQPPPSFPPGVTMSGGPGLGQYAGSHQFARAFVLDAAAAQVPVSWARTAYHSVHTFLAVGPDGVRRPVRFNWQPVDGVFPVPPNEMPSMPTDFLTAEMRDRLAHAPARFTLRMSIGDPGDALNDPTEQWPVTRRSISMGTLYLEAMADGRTVDVNRLSFNPMRLPHGIEPSGDPILHARGEIYAMACGERSGLRCPMHSGNGRAT